MTIPAWADLSWALLNWFGPISGVLGIFVGAFAGGVCWWSLRRQRAQTGQACEELHILLRQHQTEYEDGIGRVGRAVEFLEQSARSTENALQCRLTHAVRAQAMNLLRSGMSPEKAASTMGMARVDVRLIAKVARVLSSQ